MSASPGDGTRSASFGSERPWLVMGFGVTGRAVARHLVGSGSQVVAVDDRAEDATRAAAAGLGVELVESPSAGALVSLVAAAAAVVVSPGVPASHPVFAAAGQAGVEVVSEVELAWRSRPLPIVAITGTNGKTTVTTMVTAMLQAAGRRAVAAGNIGTPLIDAVAGDVDVVVAELSSFQLQFTSTFRPVVAVWLNLAEDHLDWHPDMAHYAAAKARIWANQTPEDVAVVNADDDRVAAAATTAPGRVVTFALERPADWHVADGGLRAPDGALVAALDELPRRLPHDLANALAASAAAVAAGADVAACRSVLASFEGLPHRVELVAHAGGVAWYDDSKATTPASVLAALRGFDSVVLIAGGRNKGLDLGVLREATDRIRAVVAIGEAADEIAAVFAGSRPVEVAPTMRAAVAAAARMAADGDAVVLSPGCASFDWYRSYAERGDDFASEVRSLLAEVGR